MKNRPLAGKKILITRPKEQSKDLENGIKDLGATAIQLPLIEIEALPLSQEIQTIFDQLEEIDWLVFTSTNAVNCFFKLADEAGVKFYFYPNLKIATVGEKTKMQLEQLGYRTNFVPIKYTAQVLAENMDPNLKGKKIVIPCSNKANKDYIKYLSAQGAEVLTIEVYRNSAKHYRSQELMAIIQEEMDYITFASGSAVKSFCKNGLKDNKMFQSAKNICIGPSTAAVAEELGLKINGIAEPHTSEGIIDKIKSLENV